MSTPRLEQRRGESPKAPRRKPASQTQGGSAAMYPPALPYRSFKIALAGFKRQNMLHDRLDRGAFSSKLFNTNLRETIEAYRFLGLIDADSTPTSDFRELVQACGEAGWPGALRSVLERSYHRLLACEPANMTSGLLRAFRSTYGVGAENSRKRCTFFLHACRDAGLVAPANHAADTRTGSGVAMRGSVTGESASRSHAPAIARTASGHAKDLLQKLPAYDVKWSDEVKRLWFIAFHDLVQRLHT